MLKFLFKSVCSVETWHSNILHLDSTEDHNSIFTLLQKPLVEQLNFYIFDQTLIYLIHWTMTITKAVFALMFVCQSRSRYIEQLDNGQTVSIIYWSTVPQSSGIWNEFRSLKRLTGCAEDNSLAFPWDTLLLFEFERAAFLVLVLHHLLRHHPGNQTPFLLQEQKLELNLSFPDQWRRDGDEKWRDLFWSCLKIILIPALHQTAAFTAIMWKICPAKHLSAGMKLKSGVESSACPHIPSLVSLPAQHPLPHLSLHRDPRPLITSVSIAN